MKESITTIENVAVQNEIKFEHLPELKQDLEFLNKLFTEYNNKLNEINRIINNYSNIEKRTRSVLRQHRRVLEKIRNKEVS